MNDLIYHALAEELLKALLSLIVLVNSQVKLQTHLALGLYLGCVHHFDELGNSFLAFFQNKVIGDHTPIMAFMLLIVNTVYQTCVIMPRSFYYRGVRLDSFVRCQLIIEAFRLLTFLLMELFHHGLCRHLLFYFFHLLSNGVSLCLRHLVISEQFLYKNFLLSLS